MTAHGGGGGEQGNASVDGGNGGSYLGTGGTSVEAPGGAGDGNYLDAASKPSLAASSIWSGGAGGYAHDGDTRQLIGGKALYGGGGGGAVFNAVRSGGASTFGGNGGASVEIDGDGTPGVVPGGGGGGNRTGSGTPIGGDGGAGRVIVTEYYS